MQTARQDGGGVAAVCRPAAAARRKIHMNSLKHAWLESCRRQWNHLLMISAYILAAIQTQRSLNTTTRCGLAACYFVHTILPNGFFSKSLQANLKCETFEFCKGGLHENAATCHASKAWVGEGAEPGYTRATHDLSRKKPPVSDYLSHRIAIATPRLPPKALAGKCASFCPLRLSEPRSNGGEHASEGWATSAEST